MATRAHMQARGEESPCGQPPSQRSLNIIVRGSQAREVRLV